MIAKYDIDLDDFDFANTLTAAAIAALPKEVNGKNRIEAEEKLKSNLMSVLGTRRREYSKLEKPTVSIKTERYPRVLDEMQNIFRRKKM